MVDYAFENIPLYKKKYSEVGFKSGDIRSFADFERLPILYKDELIDGFPSQIVKIWMIINIRHVALDQAEDL